MNTIATFSQVGDFAACYAAKDWLRERGFSLGGMQADEPRAIWLGKCSISKWRGLSLAEKREMHGQMTGNQRNGPVRISICRGATPDALAAFALPSK